MERRFYDAQREEIYDKLRLDILSGSSETLSFGDTGHKEVLLNIIHSFWSTLRSRLKVPGLTYLNLFIVKQNDLAIYDNYLLSYLKRTKALLGFSDSQIEEFEYLLEQYKSRIPMSLNEFRKRLLSIRTKQLGNKHFLIQFDDQPGEVQCKINKELVTFRSVQLR